MTKFLIKTISMRVGVLTNGKRCVFLWKNAFKEHLLFYIGKIVCFSGDFNKESVLSIYTDYSKKFIMMQDKKTTIYARGSK